MRKQVNGSRRNAVKKVTASRRPNGRPKTNTFVGSGELPHRAQNSDEGMQYATPDHLAESGRRPGTTGSYRKAALTRRREPELLIERGQPDPDTVRPAIREWLVPLLVKQFLAEQKSGHTKNTVNRREPISEFHGERTR